MTEKKDSWFNQKDNELYEMLNETNKAKFIKILDSNLIEHVDNKNNPDHGIGHFLRVTKIIYKILDCSPLEEILNDDQNDIFILLCAIYFHDVGLINGGHQDHALRSIEALSEFRKNDKDTITNIQNYNIEIVIKSHGVDNVNKLINDNQSRYSKSNNLRFLCALLRTGDLLDTTAERISSVAEGIKKISGIAKRHWLTCKTIKQIEISKLDDSESIAIELKVGDAINQNNDFYKCRLIYNTINWMRKELEINNEFLFEKRIRIGEVKSDYDIYSELENRLDNTEPFSKIDGYLSVIGRDSDEDYIIDATLAASENYEACIIFGKSGIGKSTFLKNKLCHSFKQLDFVVHYKEDDVDVETVGELINSSLENEHVLLIFDHFEKYKQPKNIIKLINDGLKANKKKDRQKALCKLHIILSIKLVSSGYQTLYDELENIRHVKCFLDTINLDSIIPMLLKDNESRLNSSVIKKISDFSRISEGSELINAQIICKQLRDEIINNTIQNSDIEKALKEYYTSQFSELIRSFQDSDFSIIQLINPLYEHTRVAYCQQLDDIEFKNTISKHPFLKVENQSIEFVHDIICKKYIQYSMDEKSKIIFKLLKNIYSNNISKYDILQLNKHEQEFLGLIDNNKIPNIIYSYINLDYDYDNCQFWASHFNAPEELLKKLILLLIKSITKAVNSNHDIDDLLMKRVTDLMYRLYSEDREHFSSLKSILMEKVQANTTQNDHSQNIYYEKCISYYILNYFNTGEYVNYNLDSNLEDTDSMILDANFDLKLCEAYTFYNLFDLEIDDISGSLLIKYILDAAPEAQFFSHFYKDRIKVSSDFIEYLSENTHIDSCNLIRATPVIEDGKIYNFHDEYGQCYNTNDNCIKELPSIYNLSNRELSVLLFKSIVVCAKIDSDLPKMIVTKDEIIEVVAICKSIFRENQFIFSKMQLEEDDASIMENHLYLKRKYKAEIKSQLNIFIHIANEPILEEIFLNVLCIFILASIKKINTCTLNPRNSNSTTTLYYNKLFYTVGDFLIDYDHVSNLNNESSHNILNTIIIAIPSISEAEYSQCKVIIPNGIQNNDNMSSLIAVVIGDTLFKEMCAHNQYLFSYVILWEDRISSVSSAIDAWEYELQKIVEVIKSNEFINKIFLIGDVEQCKTAANKLLDIQKFAYDYDLPRNLSVKEITNDSNFKHSILKEYILSEEYIYNIPKNILAVKQSVNNDLKILCNNIIDNIEKKQNPRGVEKLIFNNLDDAYLYMIASLFELGVDKKDSGGKDIKELQSLNLKISDPSEEYCLTYRKHEANSYYQSQWVAENGIIKSIIDSKSIDELNQKDLFCKRLAKAISNNKTTRKLAFSFYKSPDDIFNEITAPSLFNCFVFFDIVCNDTNTVDCNIDITFVWRTNECVFGLPLSLWSSIQWFKMQIIPEVREILNQNSPNIEYNISICSYSYLGINMHCDNNDIIKSLVYNMLNGYKES